MKSARFTSVWQLGLAALGVSFAVSRGPDEPVGGEDVGGQGSGATSSDGGKAGSAGNGGTDAMGGDPTIDPNPFGGETYMGGAPPVVDGPPEVVEVSPADAAEGVEPTGAISLLFSEGLDEATVTSDNIQVVDRREIIDGELAYSGVVATFTPAQRLSLLATYDVSASEAVTDTLGQALKAPFASSFTVRDGVWSSQRAVFNDTTIDSERQDVASDAQGNSLFVWTSRPDESGSNYVLYARWYDMSGLKVAVTLDDCTNGCDDVRLAVSPEGDAIVGWTTNLHEVRARRYVGGAWERASLTVGTDPTSSYPTPAFAIGGGQVVAAWARHQTTPSNYYLIEMSATSVSGAWPATPTSNYSVGYASPNYEQINGVSAAVDASGAALVAFQHSSSATTSSTRGVYYARKAPGEDWEYPVKIPSSTAAGAPVIASDGDGAMAVWIAPSGNDYLLMASRYTKTKQFVAPVRISDLDLAGYIYFGQTYSLVSSGTSYFATWTQSVGNHMNTYVTRFDIATSEWDTTPALVSDGTANSRGNASVGVDAHGNALVAFDQDGATTSQIRVARYVASSDEWSVAEALTKDGNDYGFPKIAVAANGVAALFFGPTYRDGPLHGTGTAPRGQYRIFK
jgi:hypothetical protein